MSRYRDPFGHELREDLGIWAYRGYSASGLLREECTYARDYVHMVIYEYVLYPNG